jgi:DNA-binding LytR/AlgR family response regulator
VKILVVDDEPPARRRLRRMLQELEPEAQVEEAADAEEADRCLDETVDLVFMDISMPGESGMELCLRRSCLPPLVFVTAYHEHAVEAFEVRALDYLVKPVSLDRLRRAVDRWHAWRSAESNQAVGPGPSPAPATVTARRAGMIQLFRVDGIPRFWASSKYTCFEQDGMEYLIDDSLNQLQDRFPQFVRIHRSQLVNLDFVQAVDRRGGGASVHLSSGDVVHVSRRYLKPLLSRLGI